MAEIDYDRFISGAPLLEPGGWVLGGILLLSLLAWSLLVWKWLGLRDELRGGRGWTEGIVASLRRGETREALARCRTHPGMAGRVLTVALSAVEPQRRTFERQVAPLLEGESVELRRHLPLVAALAGLLPLLGLLGTVLGMWTTFDALALGAGADMSSIADGISQALLTTQAGLVTALPVVLLHGWLSSRVERRIDEVTLCMKKIETIRCRQEDA